MTLEMSLSTVNKYIQINSAMKREDLKVPQPDIKDVAHLGVTTFLNSIPGLAGVGELFKFIVSPSLDKRKDKWMETVKDALIELESRPGFKQEDLQNEEFITLLIQASQIAVKTHLDSKRIFLKRALVGSFIEELNFNISSEYLNTIDRLQPVHISLLKIFTNIESMTQFGEKGKYLNYMMEHMPENIEISFVESFILDLQQLGLITNEFITYTTEGALLGEPYYTHVLSNYGHKFLTFLMLNKEQ